MKQGSRGFCGRRVCKRLCVRSEHCPAGQARARRRMAQYRQKRILRRLVVGQAAKLAEAQETGEVVELPSTEVMPEAPSKTSHAHLGSVTYREDIDRDLPYKPLLFDTSKEAWEALFKVLEQAEHPVSMFQKVELTTIVE